jgi:hypothetical protein
MLAKQLEYLGNALSAGIVLGARVPIVLTSRADTAETRIASCVIAALIAHAAARPAEDELNDPGRDSVAAARLAILPPRSPAGSLRGRRSALPDAAYRAPQLPKKISAASRAPQAVISRLFQNPRPALWITTFS